MDKCYHRLGRGGKVWERIKRNLVSTNKKEKATSVTFSFLLVHFVPVLMLRSTSKTPDNPITNGA